MKLLNQKISIDDLKIGDVVVQDEHMYTIFDVNVGAYPYSVIDLSTNTCLVLYDTFDNAKDYLKNSKLEKVYYYIIPSTQVCVLQRF